LDDADDAAALPRGLAGAFVALGFASFVVVFFPLALVFLASSSSSS